MFKALSFCIAVCCAAGSFGQKALYDFRKINYTNELPKGLNTQRSVVIVGVNNEQSEFEQVGNWKALAEKAHKAFVQMGVDPIVYLNNYTLLAGNASQESYSQLFTKRKIKNLIFLNQSATHFEIGVIPFSTEGDIIKEGSDAYFLSRETLYDLLLEFGIEIKRSNVAKTNFLIPEKPTFLSGISIVEKQQLKKYPGQLRRSKLAVEKFSKMSVSGSADDQLQKKIDAYNASIEQKNTILEQILQEYPFEYTFIDRMSDEDLLRNRHQFVLRSIYGEAYAVREMLEYKVNPSETAFASLIPIMPDQTVVKTFPKSALVHKFYVKQNISKNVHVGEWDADDTWEKALRNYIRHFMQYLEKQKQ